MTGVPPVHPRWRGLHAPRSFASDIESCAKSAAREREGKDTPVVMKALVNLDAPVFAGFCHTDLVRCRLSRPLQLRRGCRRKGRDKPVVRRALFPADPRLSRPKSCAVAAGERARTSR